LWLVSAPLLWPVSRPSHPAPTEGLPRTQLEQGSPVGKPFDRVVVVGDVNSTMAATLAATLAAVKFGVPVSGGATEPTGVAGL